jgi:hypothetical protein
MGISDDPAAGDLDLTRKIFFLVLLALFEFCSGSTTSVSVLVFSICSSFIELNSRHATRQRVGKNAVVK